jgi:hypothetical protein
MGEPGNINRAEVENIGNLNKRLDVFSSMSDAVRGRLDKTANSVEKIVENTFLNDIFRQRLSTKPCVRTSMKDRRDAVRKKRADVCSEKYTGAILNTNFITMLKKNYQNAKSALTNFQNSESIGQVHQKDCVMQIKKLP